MRKTKRFVAILLVMAIVLGGCGSSNKSDAELTDIEQFRCHDSIQTVFEVLGETELETGLFESEYYEYEDLNLWGYNGDAIFRVRNDKDTIQSFYCNLQLNKKELEDVLSQIENKYGEYEKSEYTNQIAYAWEIPEEKAGEIGYNRIVLIDCGDKKVIVDFSDEWSIKTDEFYYEHLKKEKNETENIVIDEFSYIYEEKSKIDCYLFESEDDKKLNLMITISSKENGYAFSAMCYMNAEIELATTDSELGYIISMSDGEDIFGTIREGGKTSRIGESKIDSEKLDLGEEDIDKSIEFHNQLKDFLEKNGL